MLSNINYDRLYTYCICFLYVSLAAVLFDIIGPIQMFAFIFCSYSINTVLDFKPNCNKFICGYHLTIKAAKRLFTGFFGYP